MAINENLVKILLYDPQNRFYALFDYVNLDAFDIASDAFRTFRVRIFQVSMKKPEFCT